MIKANTSLTLRRLTTISLILGVMATTACTVVEDTLIKAELENTKWRATTIDGVPLPADVNVTMNFTTDGSVSGSAGCNAYSASDVRTSSGLEFVRIATTRMLCPEPQMTTELAFIAALGDVTDFRYNLEDQLVLFGPDVTILFDPAS